MKLLFLTSRVPFPPHRGDKLRTYNFLRVLSRDHEILLVSFVERGAETALAELRPFCAGTRLVHLPPWRSWVHAALLYPLPRPSQLTFYASSAMAQALREAVSQFQPDAAYVHLFRMAQYLPCIPPSCITVLDLTDVISKELFRSVPYLPRFIVRLFEKEAYRIRVYERSIVRRAYETWVISDADRRDLLAAGGEGNIQVVPNGFPASPRVIPRSPDPHLAVFYGYASVQHNADALRILLNDILPRVQHSIPGIRLSIVGAGKRKVPQPRTQTHPFPLEEHGFLDSPEEVFARAALLIAPVRFSAGAQNKVLEALATGVPVVTSPLGNEGIGGQDGEHLAICRTPEEFAGRITHLLRHPEEREAMGKRGQEFARTHFSWETARRRMQVIAETRV